MTSCGVRAAVVAPHVEAKLKLRRRTFLHLAASLAIAGCGPSVTAPAPSAAPSRVTTQASRASEPEIREPDTSAPERQSGTGPIEPLPELRIYHVIADEAEGERLEDALSAALVAPPGDVMPAGDTAALSQVIRRPTGQCTYVWTPTALDRHVRWLRAVRSEQGLGYGLVAHWDGGATALEFEGLYLVGECPGRQGVGVPSPSNADGTRTVRVGASGPWVDVPRLYQPVANGGRFIFELLRDSLPLGIYPDPPEQGEFERQARPAPSVHVTTSQLPSGARFLRREERGVVSVYVLVETEGERWLCACDESLESICRSCRAAP